jgi:HEAT repeat protein
MPFAPAPIEELMRTLVKAVRAQQLYLPNNPMHRSAIDALRSSFAMVWKETDELALAVSETALTWLGAPVLLEAAKSSDNLAWLFYKDGIREIVFLKGIEETDIIRFLEIVGRARKASVDDDDLVTMLWEADFSTLKHRYVDLLMEGSGAGGTEDLPRTGSVSGPGASPDAVRAGTESAVAESNASGVVNMADFDATLHFLDAAEVDYLNQEIAREYAQDLRSNVVAALLDVFEQQPIDAVREEILDDLETMLAYLLASGGFRGVGYLLAETAAAANRSPDLSPDLRARVAQLNDRLSSPAAVEQLLESLDDAPTLPATAELTALFDQLRPSALGTVFSWLPRVRSEELRALVNEAAGRLAAMNTGELVRLVQSSDEPVSNEAIRRTGALKAQVAVLALGKIVNEPDQKRRMLAAQALAEIGSPGALQAIERCLVDADRDVRIFAARAMAAKSHRPVLARLEPIIRSKEIRERDVTEKTAFFECYAAVSGDASIPQLDAILNGKGFLGRREDSDTRAAAAIALGRVGTGKARESLQSATGEKDAVVRNAVARALRGASA